MVKSRRMRWARHAQHTKKKGNEYRALLGNPQRKRHLGKPRSSEEYKIEMNLRGIGRDGAHCIRLFQDKDR
jgi:hypothetical protein